MADEHQHTHDLDLWMSKDGDVVGAPVLLSPEEAMELRETGRVTITLNQCQEGDDDRGEFS